MVPPWKAQLGNDRVPQRNWLKMPVIGLEAEFNVFLDGVEIIPEAYWKHPSRFIDAPLLKRTKKSSQLPTGGAVYFDRGVIEVVTPVIELAPGSTARVVRSLWEQMEFVRDQLTQWEKRTGHHVRLRAYSTHYNVSFELRKKEQNKNRNIKKLALLLAYILPVPAMLAGANRRSTGIGVRPRGNRIEITADFTPDPALMIATTTLIVGIVREVISWPSYDLSLIDTLGIPIVRDVIPGKHTTRKGWLTKDFMYPQSPYTCDIDERIWETPRGELLSLREMALRTAWVFRKSIRRFADPFSYRLLFAILNGRAPSLLDLRDRPSAYDDVGRLCRWGTIIHELKSFQLESRLIDAKMSAWNDLAMAEFVKGRERENSRYMARLSDDLHREATGVQKSSDKHPGASQSLMPAQAPRPSGAAATATRSVRMASPPRAKKRRGNGQALASKRNEYVERRTPALAKPNSERRRRDRRAKQKSIPFNDRRLTRSAYERVFLKLVSGGQLRIGSEVYTPVGMKGWYHAIFKRASDGAERLLTIDQLLQKMDDWT